MVRMRNMFHGQPTHLIENGTQWAHVYQKSNKVVKTFGSNDKSFLDFENNLRPWCSTEISRRHKIYWTWYRCCLWWSVDCPYTFSKFYRDYSKCRLKSLFSCPWWSDTYRQLIDWQVPRSNLVQTTKFLQRKLLQFSVCFLFLYYSQLSNLPKTSSALFFRDWKSKSDNHVEEFGKENSYYLRSMRIL